MDDALDEIEILGFPLCSPFLLINNSNTKTITSHYLHNNTGRYISIDGYYIHVKTVPTSQKEDMCFGTFLDRDGCFFDTVHFPDALRKYPFKGRGCYLIQGIVVEEFGFLSIEVKNMQKLDVSLSRDNKNTYAAS